jgi:hypothetical protein
MVVLDPLMILQYGCWRWRRGNERTMDAYLRDAGDDSQNAVRRYLPESPATPPPASPETSIY